MIRTSLALISFLALAGCSKSKPATTTGAGGTSDLKAYSDSMADAPVQKLGTVETHAPCNQNGYMKLDVAPGTAFTIEAKVSKGSASVSVLDKDGNAVGDLLELSDAAGKTTSSTGQEGTTYITVTETGACVGNTITLTIK